MKKKALLWHPAISALLLLLVLAITTGWAQATSPDQSANLGAGRAPVGPIAFHAPRSTMARSRSASAPTMAGNDLAGANLSAQSVAEMRLADTGRTLFAARLLSNRAVPAPAPKVAAASQPAPKPAAPKYTDVNHVWIPSLGISRHVYPFACTRKRQPGNVMYRWGCAGTNNVYLLGHASGVFKALHRAYNTGRLRVGMLAIYADGAGHIRRYRVTEWQVVDPVEVAWAIASQPVPSMTLQTCVGPDGVDRLNVRLVAVK